MSKFVSWQQCRSYASLASFAPVALDYALWHSTSGSDSTLPIFMLHGLMGNKENLQSSAQGLTMQGSRNVYTLNMRNHGASPHCAEHSCGHVAADVAALMQVQGLQQIIAFGHSSGGRGMMTLALTQPQLVERLIVSDISPLTLPAQMMSMTDIFELMISQSIPAEMSLGEGRKYFKLLLDDKTGNESFSQLILKNLVKLPSGEFHWLVNARAILNNWLDFTHYHDTIIGLEPYEGPTLFVAGEQSSFVQPEDVPGIKQYFPNMRLEWLNTGHLVHVDRPHEFIKLLLDFTK